MNQEDILRKQDIANNETGDQMSLSELFDKAMNSLESLEESPLSSNSSEYQSIVKKSVFLLEKATHMVNNIGVFSSNEVIEEVTTADLKYLLLPALLGTFILKIVNSNHHERLENVTLAELYFKDFLKRCKDYEVPNAEIEEIDSEKNYSSPKENEKLLPANLLRMAENRQHKIKQFKLLQDVKESEKRLKMMMTDEQNEEVLRNFYLVQLRKWILLAQEELNSISMEKSVLQHMSKINPSSEKEITKQKPKALKPIIIVKDKLQKEVFGLGYPSMPTMTVDEFYKERYPEHSQESGTTSVINNLQEMAMNPDAKNKQAEQEDIQEEENIEKDDPLTLQRLRAFDDWKDTHRRGCGNRMNMG